MFAHEKLHVYTKALAFVAATSAQSAAWNKRHAELDHRHFLDIAAGAAVKVAAYLDLAVQKLTFDRKECEPAKLLLERIVAMLSRM